MELFSLHVLEAFLKKEGYQSLYIEPTKQDVYPKLALFVGQDKFERERTIEIVMKDQIVDFTPQSKEVIYAPYCTLQFQFTFPFKANDITLVDTNRLVSFMNRNFEMPGLEFDEVSGTIYYRYVMLLNKANVDLPSIAGVIGIIMLCLEMFGDALEQVATGKMTTNQLLEMAVLAVRS